MLCTQTIFLSNILPLRWDLFFQPLPIIFLATSLIFAALIWLIWKKREKQDLIIGPKELGATDSSLKLFYGWVPVILGIHVAVALLVNGVPRYCSCCIILSHAIVHYLYAIFAEHF